VRVFESSPADPWKALPPRLAAPFRARLPRLAEQITAGIQREAAELGQSPYALGVRLGVERALGEFADRLAEGRGPARGADGADPAHIYRLLGLREVRAGRTLDALQASFRLAGQIVWRALVEVGAQAGVPLDEMYGVSEAVFRYVDELAGHTREGYAQARDRIDGEIRRRRRTLVELLVQEPGPGQETVAELARAARWTLPPLVQAVALRRPEDDGTGPEPRSPAVLGADQLLYAGGAQPYVLAPDNGHGTRVLIERAVGRWAAAVGPPVPVGDAGRSLRWARRLLDLEARGYAGPQGSNTAPGSSSARTLHCVDHLPALVLSADEELLRTLTRRRLAPLDAAPAHRRDRLAETLLCWLECAGSAPEVARRLNVHPQTVRYRLRHLDELFGAAMRDPGQRFELELALRGRSLPD
jgi:hypothetical protein